jgi:hypothetical protein
MLKNIGTTDVGIVSAINFLIRKGALIFLVICFPKKTEKRVGRHIIHTWNKMLIELMKSGLNIFISWFFSGQISHIFQQRNWCFVVFWKWCKFD